MIDADGQEVQGTSPAEGLGVSPNSPSPTISPSTVPLWAALVPVIAALAIMLAMSQRSDGRLHLWVFDVGEGDAILLLTPRGHTVLVDGGPGVTPLAESVGKHLPFWQHNLDVAVLTEPQQENMMGLVDLLARYKIGQVVQTEFSATTTLQRTWLDALKNGATPVQHVKRGDLIGFEDEPEVTLRVLNPGESDILKGDTNTLEHNRAIMLKLEYGGTSILLAGDIQTGAEANMLRLAGDQLSGQVLKVADHGSDHASTQGFIDAVQPLVSIISVGADNKLGYPAPDILDRLHNSGSQLYRTDQNGTIEIIAEKDRFWVQSAK
jgi:competence protein ComEC